MSSEMRKDRARNGNEKSRKERCNGKKKQTNMEGDPASRNRINKDG
jgi:hypothetical protein